MVYLALMAGADGVVSHALGLPAIGGRGSYYIPRDQPELWAGMVETNRQLNWLALALLGNEPRPVELPWDCPVQMALWDKGDSRVVVAVNTADTTAAIGFDVGAQAGEEVALPFENRCIVANDVTGKGIDSATEVGSTNCLVFLGFLRGGARAPTQWQLSTGTARKLPASPSRDTVELPMKTSDSLPGGLTKTPPMGMWDGGMGWQAVPA